MDIPKIDLSNNKIWNRIFVRKNIIHPKRDWIILTVFFIAMLLSAIIFDAFLYLRIVSGDMYISIDKNELVLENLESSEIEFVIDGFELRKDQVDSLRDGIIRDPSL
jgi:hypothetical protein